MSLFATKSLLLSLGRLSPLVSRIDREAGTASAWVMVIEGDELVVDSCLWHGGNDLHVNQRATIHSIRWPCTPSRVYCAVVELYMGCCLLCSWTIAMILLQQLKTEMLALLTHCAELRMTAEGHYIPNCPHVSSI